jgi:hypothetical protein
MFAGTRRNKGAGFLNWFESAGGGVDLQRRQRSLIERGEPVDTARDATAREPSADTGENHIAR